MQAELSNSDTCTTSISEKPEVQLSTVAEKYKSHTLALIMTFVGLQIAFFLAALDSTIISTALPTIGSDFNQASIVSWVATAYILTYDSFQPLFAKLSDIFGRKFILIFGISIFLLGSALCGAAKNMIMLIVSRAIAGIGAAGIISMVYIIISDIIPLEKRASYQGVLNMVYALSSVLGPLIGGSFTDYVTWRWNFYINLPIGAIPIPILFYYLDLPTPEGKLSEKLKRVDYAGTVITLTFSTLLLLALNFGGQIFPWKSAAVIVPLILSGLLVGLLVLVEKKFAKEPLMPPRLFRNRSVVSILFVNWFLGMAFFAAVYYLPVYFQVVRDDSAMWSGIRLIPMQAVLCITSVASGFIITKTGRYRPLIYIGMGLLVLWMGLTSLYDETTPFSRIYGITIIGSGALGFCLSSTIIALQTSVEIRDIAVVTGLGNFSRILGGAIGVAIASAVLNSHLTQELPLRLPAEETYKIIASSEYVNHGLSDKYKSVAIEIYISGLQMIWYVLVAMAALGFIASFFIEHHSVRQNTKTLQEEGKGDSMIEIKIESEADLSSDEKTCKEVPFKEEEN